MGGKEFEKLTPRAVLQHEIQLFLVLETGDHLHQEWMAELC